MKSQIQNRWLVEEGILQEICNLGLKDASLWAYKHEHEQAIMSTWTRLNRFKNILYMSSKYYEKCFLHIGHNFCWHGKIFCHVSMDEWSLWINFILNVANKCYFCGKLNKKNKVEIIYVGFFITNPQMKCSSHNLSHISYFLNIKYIQTL
jgi:hypothetical protein